MKTYAQFLAEHFSSKIRKLPIDTALGCPHGGRCTYCLNAAFSPDAGKAARPIAEQLERGKRFFAGKYQSCRYLAYFQSYTSTNAPTSALMEMFGEAMADKDVAGVAVSTRPDSVPDELLAAVKSLPKPVFFEIGAESSHDATLRRVNRGHTWADTADTVARIAAAGIPVGIHLINGLPGEDEAMMLESAMKANALPIDSIKFHHLQILRGTPLGQAFLRGEELDVIHFTPESYAALWRRITDVVRRDIAIDRFVAEAPRHLLLSPKWGIKPCDFNLMLTLPTAD